MAASMRLFGFSRCMRWEWQFCRRFFLAPPPGSVNGSSTVTSPDNRWVVLERGEAWDGPGTGAYGTTLYLARSDRPRDGTEIISYASLTRPQISWPSAHSLVVRVPHPEDLLFQAVKLGDMQISVETLVSPSAAAPP